MSDLVTVEVYDMVARAEVVQGYLEERGIKSYLADEQTIAMDWLLMSAVGGVKLQVASEDVDAARRILQQVQDEKDQRAKAVIEFACDECQKPLSFTGDRRGGVETCSHCGCYVDVPE